jgi:SSS family solute:Na+ symporter
MQIGIEAAWAVIIIYFAINIWLGWWSKRAIVSPEDYHIAGRKVGAFINGSAYCAGYLSIASFLGLPAFIFLLGMPFDWALLGIASAMPFGAALVAAQLRKAAPVSTTDYFAWRYDTDRYGRAILTVAYMWGSILYITLCLVGMGLMFVSILRVHYVIALIIVTVIMLFYLWLGGMVATTLTSAFQCWVMLIAAWAIVAGMFAVAGGPAQLFAVSKELQPHFFVSGPYNAAFVKTMVKAWFDPAMVFASGFFAMFCWYMVWNWGSIVMPYAIVGVFRAFDRRTARWTLFWAPLFVWLFYVALTIIGIGARPVIEVFGPHPVIEEAKKLSPALPSVGVFRWYYINYGIGSLTDYATIAVAEAIKNPWILGLAGAGILAIGMSTVASWAMISGTIIARDWPRFVLRRGALPLKKELLLARITMVVLLIVSLFIALAPPALVLDLSGAAFLVIVTVCGPPMFLGIWWKRGGPTTFKIYATLMFILTTFSWVFSYLVWGSPHACTFYPSFATPHQVYWYVIGLVVWIILCLVTKPAKPETIKRYCEDLHTP